MNPQPDIPEPTNPNSNCVKRRKRDDQIALAAALFSVLLNLFLVLWR